MSNPYRIVATLTMAALLASAQGCKKEQAPTQEITTVRAATDAEKKAEAMGTAERMHMSQMPAGHGGLGGAGAAPAAAAPEDSQKFRWATPEGWEELAPTPMRIANLKLKDNPEVEMYFTVMPGDGGGLLANVNRWYGQMGQEPLTQEQLDALPSRIFLFRPAPFVNIKGSFKGMGGEAKENYGLLGLALIAEGHAAFLKLTGPADVVDGKLNDFVTFSQSIVPANLSEAPTVLKAVPGDGDTPPAEAAAPAETMPVPAAEAAPAAEAPAAPQAALPGTGGELPAADALKWDVPEGWQAADQRPMRVVTLNVGASECYISVLGGQAGGVEANINRWCGQLGRDPFTPEAIAAMEQVEVLGAPCALVSLEGDYQGMGGPVQTGYGLLGIVRATETQSLFVKMVGPKDEIAAQADNFRAFVRSLR